MTSHHEFERIMDETAPNKTIADFAKQIHLDYHNGDTTQANKNLDNLKWDTQNTVGFDDRLPWPFIRAIAPLKESHTLQKHSHVLYPLTTNEEIV